MTSTAQTLTATAQVGILETLKTLRWQQNSLHAYLVAFGTLLALWLLLIIFKRYLLGRIKTLAERTDTDLDDFLVEQLSRVGFLVFFPISLYLASRPLLLPRQADQVLLWLAILALTFRGVRFIQDLLGYLIESSMAKGASVEDAALRAATLRSFRWLINGVLWLVAGLFLLSNLGVNVSSVLAGLGVGGIAIALALQSVFRDLLASLNILFDKPFVIGDSIQVGSTTGKVESIGLRSTRLRSPVGELVVVPNGDLVAGRVQNFKQLKERRQLWRLSLVYGTATDRLEKVPGLLQACCAAVPKVRFDRAHLAALGPSGVEFELVFFVESADYGEYMEASQAVALGVLRSLAEAGMELAYPTQTLLLRGEGRAKEG